MRKIWEPIFLICFLFLGNACNDGTSPKALKPQLVGEYVDNSINGIEKIITLNSTGKNISILYKEINSETVPGKPYVSEKVTFEIENALFVFDKKENAYSLNQETIKNMIVTKEKITDVWRNKKMEKTYQDYIKWREETASDGLSVEFQINDTRDEVRLVLFSTGLRSTFIYFEGYKK